MSNSAIGMSRKSSNQSIRSYVSERSGSSKSINSRKGPGSRSRKYSPPFTFIGVDLRRKALLEKVLTPFNPLEPASLHINLKDNPNFFQISDVGLKQLKRYEKSQIKDRTPFEICYDRTTKSKPPPPPPSNPK